MLWAYDLKCIYSSSTPFQPLDHEAGANIKLEVMARNEAELEGTKATWPTIPVAVTVTDEDEGPEFSAPILMLRVKENVDNGTVIGTYTARDPETKSSEGIKYVSYAPDFDVIFCIAWTSFFKWQWSQKRLSTEEKLMHTTCHLAEAFIQSDLQLIRLCRRHTPKEQCGVKGLAQGPKSCADLIMATPGIEPPTLGVQVK